MGTIFLLLLIFLEVGLVIMTFMRGRKKKEWRRNRLLLSSAEWVAITLFLLLPMVKFDFRFKVCVYMLLFRLLVAVIKWACKHEKDEGTIGRGILIWKLVGNAFVLFFCLVPALVFTGYEGLKTTGEYNVKLTQAILRDDNRTEAFETDGTKREVPVHFYYPDAEEGTFPLVVFSHGAFGYYQSNSSTYLELASHGYIVVSLDHPYHSFFTKDTDGKLITVNTEFINEVMSVSQEALPERDFFENEKSWVELRKGDMNLVLDSIKKACNRNSLDDAWFTENQQEKNDVEQALKLTNCDKIGVMGHSLGGAESVYIGRTRDDISAVIDLDGTMLSEKIGLDGDSYVYSDEPYPVPILSIDNEEHHKLIQKAEDEYVNCHVIHNAVDGKMTYFKGSEHMNFTDLPLFSPILAKMLGTGSIDCESCIRQVNGIVLMYFDYYLKNKGEVVLKECYQ